VPELEDNLSTPEESALSVAEPAAAPPGRGLDLMMDIPLEITVELGSATLTLAEVLALGPGSVIELNRLPGEPLDLLANGHLIARGEVVVLNETFGVRLTEIIHTETLRP
jgi:flagellar motor switch protein FliN/FliY